MQSSLLEARRTAWQYCSTSHSSPQTGPALHRVARYGRHRVGSSSAVRAGGPRWKPALVRCYAQKSGTTTEERSAKGSAGNGAASNGSGSSNGSGAGNGNREYSGKAFGSGEYFEDEQPTGNGGGTLDHLVEQTRKVRHCLHIAINQDPAIRCLLESGVLRSEVKDVSLGRLIDQIRKPLRGKTVSEITTSRLLRHGCHTLQSNHCRQALHLCRNILQRSIPSRVHVCP